MPQPKKLIEVAMPVKEISAESVRDKSIRHGHISTLHLWWARRPLPVCRAVVFASLIPDPLDKNCPDAFKEAVEILLGKKNNPGDPYKPYDDIPWTAIHDPMEDNLRNRLQMFIGKFTDEMQQFLLHKKPKPAAGNQLSDFSLIKWDNKNNETILNKARKLIWVAYNTSVSNIPPPGGPRGTPSLAGMAGEGLSSFEHYYSAIREAETNLYGIKNRHLQTPEVKAAEEKLRKAVDAFQDKMPKVFDPFAGGGAIPLEAARLGCKSYGNDINPVAHIIQKGSLEFPQKYGKPILYSKEAFTKLYGNDLWNEQPQENKKIVNGEAVAVQIPNRLSFDVEFHAKKLLAEAQKQIGKYYPTLPPQGGPRGAGASSPSPSGKAGMGPASPSLAGRAGEVPIAYYWARVGTCSNPSCRAEVPLLKGFYLANTGSKQVYLKPIIIGKKIDFEIKHGKYEREGWMARGNLSCPVCGNTTDVKTLKKQFIKGETTERLLAVICDGDGGKEYRLPEKEEIEILKKIPADVERPREPMPVQYTQALPSCTWGLSEWGQMFSPRQLLALQTLVQKLQEIKAAMHPEKDEYLKAVVTYLGILMDRIAVANTSFGIWHTGRETLERPMGRQAIPMVFDYPESNPFCNSTGSALNQLEWLTRYIESECDFPFYSILQNASSGEKNQFDKKYLTAVVTDPPYYDAIAYADLSDFFYVWLKRTLGDLYALNFATPQTPKSEECTALKHHHENSVNKAKQHFENKLTQIFDAIEYQTSDIVSIMFAHQSTEAWTTLCNSILDARMNITGSWAMDTELTTALKNDKSFLESSVTVSCRPSQRSGTGDYREVKKAIEKSVSEEVAYLYALGFRGADLLTACFGQAAGEFGQYEKVEKADGSEVTVAELLEMTRQSAFNALVKGFDADDYTRFYIAWLQLFGFAETDFDDATKFTRVGLTIDVHDLFRDHIFIKNENKQTLANYEQRNALLKTLGEKPDSHLIDKIHKAIFLFKGTKRKLLLQYIQEKASNPDSSFWRALTVLCELLPEGSDDLTQAKGLRDNKDNLLRESTSLNTSKGQTQELKFE